MPANRVHNVMPVPPELHELGDHFGRVLQVPVHDDHGLTCGVIDPRTNGCLMAEIAAQVQHDNPRISALNLVKQAWRPVSTAVVNENQLIIAL
jgi:hypothetical protein